MRALSAPVSFSCTESGARLHLQKKDKGIRPFTCRGIISKGEGMIHGASTEPPAQLIAMPLSACLPTAVYASAAKRALYGLAHRTHAGDDLAQPR